MHGVLYCRRTLHVLIWFVRCIPHRYVVIAEAAVRNHAASTSTRVSRTTCIFHRVAVNNEHVRPRGSAWAVEGNFGWWRADALQRLVPLYLYIPIHIKLFEFIREIMASR